MIKNMEWSEQAACRGMNPDVFHPTSITNGIARLNLPCETCPVKKACLEYALENRMDKGIWGGMNERQRKIIRMGRKNELSQH